LTYSKTAWKDRQVEFPNRYTMVDNGDGTYTLTPAPGTVTAEGTPISAANQNNAETQYDEVKTEVEKIDGTSGIKPDWSNVKNSAHASTHASGGSDAITPADIGAETPTSAQTKADIAEANAKTYTDDKLLSGLVANRPVAGVAGRRYFATDTGRFSLDDGIAWIELDALTLQGKTPDQLGGREAPSISPKIFTKPGQGNMWRSSFS
jgi:hypothetical protein